MRPLILKMTGFGPYAKETTIDMDKLGVSGLYLITGDTGAGKTTIFDGICYALFGDPSGDMREANMLRSKYASEDTPTEVELEFEHMGKTYAIKRNPEYERKSKRGDKTTKQIAGCELTLPNGKVVTKIKDVDAEITNILGIDKNQFASIVMLAQGQFQKLLKENTDDRSKIFRELFKTGNYVKLQERIYNECKNVKDECNEKLASINQYINDIIVDEDDVLSIDINKFKTSDNAEVDVELLNDVLNKLVNNDKNLADSLKEKIENVNAKKIENATKIKEYENISESKTKLESFKEDLKIVKTDFEKVEKELENSKKEFEKKDDLVKKSKEIETRLGEYAEYEKILASKENSKKELKELDEKIKTFKLDKEELEKKTKSDEKTFEELKNVDVDLSRVKSDIEKEDKLKSEITRIKEDYDDYKDKCKEYENSQKYYSKENDNLEKLKIDKARQEKLYNLNQAGILALELKDDEPCPVCGSKAHPSKAKISNEAPSEMELEKMQKEIEKLDLHVKDIKKDLDVLSGSNRQAEESILKGAKVLFNLSDLSKLEEIIKDNLKECEEKIKNLKATKIELEKKCKEKKKLEEAVKSNKENIDKLIKELSNKEQRQIELKTNINNFEDSITSVKKKLKFESKKEAEKQLSSLEEEIKNIQKKYDNASADYKAKRDAKVSLEGQITQLENELKNVKSYDIARLQTEKEELESEYKTLNDKYVAVNHRFEANKTARENIEKSLKDQEKIENKLRWIKALDDTFNGKIKDKTKITLETYIQMAYFDRIINKANKRLVTMTNNQYELERDETSVSKKGKTGLDLNVIDRSNGSVRSVKSLSGGESFMASLCLALGLSDEVQESSGGISIDTMFVDEGFGTLDSEALNLAYKALAGLTNGNRLVGIISHVSDLKEKIDKQIVVTKNGNRGSEIIQKF